MVFGKLSLSLLHTPAHGLAAGMSSLASTRLDSATLSAAVYFVGAVLRAPDAVRRVWGRVVDPGQAGQGTDLQFITASDPTCWVIDNSIQVGQYCD